jgi:hypothetical protein
MVDISLLPAIRAALRDNEIGDQSPYVLSYARLGTSGGSFGVFQGDAHADPMAREALTQVLTAANVDPDTVARIVNAVSQPCPNGSPLSPADQQTADNALASPKGRVIVDAMDEKILQVILSELDSSIDAAESVDSQLDEGAQLCIALWVNMTGAPTTLNKWIKGQQIGAVAPPAASPVTRDDVTRYLEATKFFTDNPKNLIHFQASVDKGLQVGAGAPEVAIAMESVGKIAMPAAAKPVVSTEGAAEAAVAAIEAPVAAAKAAVPAAEAPGATAKAAVAAAESAVPAAEAVVVSAAKAAVSTAKAAVSAKDTSEDTMLGFFLSTLEVRALQIKPTVADDPVRAAVFAQFQSAFDTFPTRFGALKAPANHAAWTEAYRLERLLALAVPPSSLLMEIKRQTAEAIEERIPSASRLVTAIEAALPTAVDTSTTPLPTVRTGGEAVLRSLLLQTLEELHWNSQRKFYARPIQKSATYRIVWLGVVAFALFLLPYGIIYGDIFWRGHKPALETWSFLPLYTALTAGLFGASFSRLLYLQQNWNSFTLGAIMDAKDYTSILLRGCVGMTGAVVVYFFLQSGAMNGALFPKFGEIGFTQNIYPKEATDSVKPISLFFPNPELALLVVWCFLAGFSERLVSSILESTESSLGKQKDAK